MGIYSVWQLRWLRFEKKLMIGVAACNAATHPKMMNIAYKKDLKVMFFISQHTTCQI